MIIKGMVFNIQRYSLDDGPGIRTIVFLKGCPLRCLWCCNPESQNPWPEIAHRDSLCNNCMKCVEVCPVKAISVNEKSVCIDRKLCNACGKCVEACVREALGIYGKEMSVDDVFHEVMQDVDFYRTSNGGVTASGGEPLLQHEFVAALFQRCQQEGITTVLETSGYASRDALESVLPHTSLVLHDLKCADPELHQKLTGVSNEQILNNLAFTAKMVPVIVRIPIIPSVNDSEEEVNAMAHIIVQNKLKKVELMPYHRFGLGKYKMLDREYLLEEIASPTDDMLQRVKRIFDSYELECKIVK